MSTEPDSKSLDELVSEFSQMKNTVTQVLVALSRGIADLIRHPFKGLKNRLISLIVILLLVFNPIWGKGILGFIFEKFLGKEPDQVEWMKSFWAWWPYLFAGAVLLALTIMVWEQLTRKSLPAAQFKNPAIKGLLSFEQSDAAIFKKLEREADVQQVMSALTHQNFRFGVFTGVSGCGKTSLLKAGLLPALAEKNQRVALVTLTDEQPLASVQKAITAQLGVHFEGKVQHLNALLEAALKATGNLGFILILDQFEQFFTQNRTEKSREPFIKDIWNAYLNYKGVKILLSIRSDFMWRLHEIQQRLQYSLTAGQNYFDLRKFKPEQTVRIFRMMSEENQMGDFDEDFMLKMVTTELATNEDGLVSAVDIQLVATALQQVEGAAFDEKTFRQNGGMQGMMQQYLRKLLETPNYFNLRQESLKILLAFVDLDNNTRKGRLSGADLLQNLGDQISTHHIASSLEWLTQNRLLHQPGIAQGETPVWELAHERLIESLRALANKSLTGLDRAELLLNRRVNEWLANGKKSRFLLTRIEYSELRKNVHYLVTEPNKAAKEDLMATSRKRLQVWNRTAAAVLVLLLVAWGVFETTWFKVEVLAKNDIKQVILNYHAGSKGSAVSMLDTLSNGNPQLALDIAGILGLDERPFAYYSIWKNIKNDMNSDSASYLNKVERLSQCSFDTLFLLSTDSFPVFVLDLAVKKGKIELLHKIENAAEKIKNLNYQCWLFCNLAQSSAKLHQFELADSYFKRAMQCEEKINLADENNQSAYISGLAKTVVKLDRPEISKDFFLKSEQQAERMKDPRAQTAAFGALAEAAVELKQPLFAQSLFLRAKESTEKLNDKNYQPFAFYGLAKLSLKLGKPEVADSFLQNAMQSARKIEDFNNRVYALISLSDFALELKLPKAALSFHQAAVLNAENIEDRYLLVWICIKLSKSSEKLGLSEESKYFLQRTLQIVDGTLFEDPRFQVFDYLLRSNIDVPSFIGEIPVLLQIQQISENRDNEINRSKVFIALARFVTKLDQQETTITLLKKLKQGAEAIGHEGVRAGVFTSLAQSAEKLNQREVAYSFLLQAIQCLEEMKYEKYDLMADIGAPGPIIIDLTAMAIKMGRPDLILSLLQKMKQTSEKIEEKEARSKVLAALAKSAAKLPQTEVVKDFLESLEAIPFDPKSKAYAILMEGLSEAYAELHDFREAYTLANQIENKYPEKVFALIHLQKRYKERNQRPNR